MDHFIKNPAFSTAKMTVDQPGLIDFDCQIITFVSRKCVHSFIHFIFRSGLLAIGCDALHQRKGESDIMKRKVTKLHNYRKNENSDHIDKGINGKLIFLVFP